MIIYITAGQNLTLASGKKVSVAANQVPWSQALTVTAATLADVTGPMIDLALAKAAKSAQLATAMKAALMAEYNAWTPVQRLAMNGARDALNTMLMAGDFADAIAGVTNFPLPDSTYQAGQTAVLATLNQYAPLFAAVEAAATVAAVAAVILPSTSGDTIPVNGHVSG